MKAKKGSESRDRAQASQSRFFGRPASAGSFLPSSAASPFFSALPVSASPSGPMLQRAPIGPPKGVADWFSDDVDIDNPDVVANLRRMSRKQLLSLLKDVRQPRARLFIEQLAVPEKVERFTTGRSVPLDRADLETLAKPSNWSGYWSAKVEDAYAIQGTPPSRLLSNPKERELVNAALWNVRPSTVAKREARRVSVAVEAAGPKKAAAGPKKAMVHYRFEFGPAGKGPKPTLAFTFEREVPGDQYATAFPGAGYESFKPSTRKPDAERGFTGTTGDSQTYWRKRKQEHKKLFYWIERRMKGNFSNQEVSVDGVAYTVSATKDKGKLIRLEVELLGRNFRESVRPYLDPEKRGRIDFLLEELRDPATKGGALGDVILEGVPADEVLSVKYAIYQNFYAGFRNRQVDIAVPIALTGHRVFYTLRFRPNNDVDAQRLAVEDSSVAFSPSKITVQRARGFPVGESNLEVHKKWLKKRYKALKITGTSPQELRENADKELATRVKTPQWLRDNYSITILNASQADARLRKSHKVKKPARANLKDFTPAELTFIEQALQPMSDLFVKKLRGVRMVRQKELLEKDGTPGEKAYGQTMTRGQTSTIRMFDLWEVEKERFMGGVAGVHAGQSASVIHEFGHVLEHRLNLRKRFNKLVKDQGAAPFTDYATAKPKSELFTEALMAYELDPEWLKSNHPVLYAWIDKRDGK